MVDGDDLTVIDFDDAGFGWFSHELACALHPGIGEPWFVEAEAAIIEGYSSVHPISQDEIESIHTFLAVRSLMIVGWLDARPELSTHQYFPLVVKGAEAAARAVCGH
jgi:Ser/Thr protein kinase RdoA (MazF antagonist)